MKQTSYLRIFTNLHKTDVFLLEVIPQSDVIKIAGHIHQRLLHQAVLMLRQNLAHEELKSRINGLRHAAALKFVKNMRQLNNHLIYCSVQNRIGRSNFPCVIEALLVENCVDFWQDDGGEYKRLSVVFRVTVQTPRSHSGKIRAVGVLGLQV